MVDGPPRALLGKTLLGSLAFCSLPSLFDRKLGASFGFGAFFLCDAAIALPIRIMYNVLPQSALVLY